MCMFEISNVCLYPLVNASFKNLMDWRTCTLSLKCSLAYCTGIAKYMPKFNISSQIFASNTPFSFPLFHFSSGLHLPKAAIFHSVMLTRPRCHQANKLEPLAMQCPSPTSRRTGVPKRGQIARCANSLIFCKLTIHHLPASQPSS